MASTDSAARTSFERDYNTAVPVEAGSVPAFVGQNRPLTAGSAAKGRKRRLF
jgi:hypothetical protein